MQSRGCCLWRVQLLPAVLWAVSLAAPVLAQDDTESTFIITDQAPESSALPPELREDRSLLDTFEQGTDGRQPGDLRLPLPTGDGTAQGPIPSTTDSQAGQSPAASALADASTQRSSPFAPILARAPYVFGDSVSSAILVKATLDPIPAPVPPSLPPPPSIDPQAFDASSACVMLPLAGGSRRTKIAEDSRALTDDRIIFTYNHFHNALETLLFDGFDEINRPGNIDRFTIGFEKSFLCNLFSLDVRMPVALDNDVFLPGYRQSGSGAGNLSTSLKCLLEANHCSSLIGGVTLSLPTGGNAVGTFNSGEQAVYVEVLNDAVYIGPFIGLLYADTPRTSHQLFVQVDVPAADNEAVYLDAVSEPSSAVLKDDTLLYVDYSYSLWLYEARLPAHCRNRVTPRRVAAQCELHYTTSLDSVEPLNVGTPLAPVLLFSQPNVHQDILNLTGGLHTELAGGATLRVGGVVPLRNERFFDSEVQVQLNIPF